MTLQVKVRREAAGHVAVALHDGRGEAIGRGSTEEQASDEAVAAAKRSLAAGRVSATLGRPRRPAEGSGESYQEYLEWHGVCGPGLGVAFPELVRRGSPRHHDPPRRLWQNAIAPLRLGLQLRDLAISFGARGLYVRGAYRPGGGAERSRHITNAAFDWDLLKGDTHLAHEFAVAAAKIYAASAHLGAGVGTYGPRRITREEHTLRVHVDACARTARTCWQIYGRDAAGRENYIKPAATVRLVKELDL